MDYSLYLELIDLRAQRDEACFFPSNRRAKRFLSGGSFRKCTTMVRGSMGDPGGFSTLFRASNLLSQYSDDI